MKNKKLLGILIALLFCMLAIPIMGFAQDPIKYIDASGTEQSTTEYTVINSDNKLKTLGEANKTTWYVVEGTVDYTEDGTKTNGITVTGEVHLILADDCSLTVTGSEIIDTDPEKSGYRAGIGVSGDDNSLTIYGQSGGTGQLTATAGTGSEGGAGIGGGSKQPGGNITINGGKVTANGGSGGAGIGGGEHADGSNITINGGKVTANGGYSECGSGAGIGNGGNSQKESSNIKIAAALEVKADDDTNPPTTKISHTSETDISGSLANKRYVTVTSPAKITAPSTTEKTYDGNALTGTATSATSSVTITYQTKTTADGTYTSVEMPPSITNAGKLYVKATASAQGYLDNSVEYTLTVNKVKVSVPTAITGLVYTGQVQTGVELPDGAKYTLSGNTATNANSAYTATATLSDKNNYEWDLQTPTTDNQSISWNIAKKAVTVTANDASKTYGAQDPELTAEVEGAVEGKDVTVIVQRSEGEAVGAYPITVSGEVSQGNYSVTYQNGTFIVNPAKDAEAKVDTTALSKIKEQYQAKNLGQNIVVEMQVSKDAVKTEEVAKILTQTGDKKLIAFDASLVVKVGDEIITNAGDKNEERIATTYQFDFSKKANIQSYRVHNGQVDELTETPNDKGEFVKYDKVAGTITVTACKYSTYAFAYDEVEEVKSTAVNTGLTGNNTTTYIAVGLILLAVIAFVGYMVWKKKRAKQDA